MSSKSGKKQTLEGTRKNAFAMDPTNLIVIGWDTDDGEEHPLYDERAKLPIDDAMVANIKVYGVLEVVHVKKDKDTGKIYVRRGRQRVKNCREANKQLVKEHKDPHEVICMAFSDEDELGAAISENEIRKGDPLSVKAAKLERYLAIEGNTEEGAAIAFGVSLQSIRNWRKISKLDPAVIKAIESGKIKGSAAWNLASLEREEQREELDKQLAAGGRVTATRTKGGAKKRTTGEDDYKPGKRVINKVLRLNEQSEVLTADFVRGVCWVLGDVNPRTVKGLTELIHEAQGDKE